MTEYRITNINDHILIESGEGLLLVDTGSPVSFHESGRMTLCGNSFRVLRSIKDASLEYISRQLGVHVCGLVGMDFIGKHPMSLDIKGASLAFDASSDGYTSIPSSTIEGRVKCEMLIDGRRAFIIPDTGAPTSYISRAFSAGKTAVGSASDFSPYCGNFTTPIYEFEASIGGREFMMRAGNLPTVMSPTVDAMADGVFGMDFLRLFRVRISSGSVLISDN